ncbi:MAG: hypothetical protein D6717_06890 [Gammaproteobacteria bacterium]|nr:MAG: hypothetical protein D6717_06890 [Gammaproteobacteria bacterium]
MKKEEPGRLHYIAGIPYLSSNHIQVAPPGRLERMLRWAAARNPVQAVFYVLLLFAMLCIGGWLIDLVIDLFF